MNRYYILIFSILILHGCNESFHTINPEKFNDIIKERTDIQDSKELIKIYCDYSEIENKKISIDKEELNVNIFRTTLIYDGIEDDSQRAIKTIMIAEKNKNRWKVIEIKENWKCWDGRGHTSWGTEICN